MTLLLTCFPLLPGLSSAAADSGLLESWTWENRILLVDARDRDPGELLQLLSGVRERL